MTTEASKAARKLSKKGASKGGRARASVLTAEERTEAARAAARARWGSAGTPVDDDSGDLSVLS